MSQARGFLLAAIAVLTGGMIGCNTVPLAEHEALKSEKNKLSEAYSDQTDQLEDSQANESRLLNEVNQLKLRLTAAETEATRLRSELARRPRTTVQVKPRTEISLGSDALFAPGQASLNGDGKRRIAQVAGQIRRQHAGAKIRVYGHTDSTPIKASKWADNLELSGQRAMAVTGS